MKIHVNLKNKSMKGSTTLIAIISVAFIVALAMVGYIIFLRPPSESISPSGYTESMAPKIPIKDFAPDLPASQKTTITIQTSDSSEIKYIVPTTQVDTYVKKLPPGYHVISKSP